MTNDMQTAKLDGATVITIPEGVKAYLVAERTNILGAKSEDIKPFEKVGEMPGEGVLKKISEMLSHKKKAEVI